MHNWNSIAFGELYAIESRNGLMRPKRTRGAGFRMINMGEIFAHDRIGDIEMDKVPMDSSEQLRFAVRGGDLLFARQSLVLEGAGKCAIVQATAELTTFESHLIRVRLNPALADPNFYFYYFKSHLGKAAIAAITMQVAAAGIRGSELATIRVPHPPVRTQQRIAKILGKYDDLIENDARRIKILEQMARMLYREWFVNFRFPGHDNLSLITSALGEIPEGWRVSTLGEVTTKIGSGATPRGGKESYQKEGITLIRSLNIYDYSFEMDNLAFINHEQAKQLNNVTIEPNDVLLNITGASVCRCSMVPSSLLPARVNQHVAIVRTNSASIDPFFLLDSINNDHNKQRLLGIAQGGATREALTKDSIAGFPILLPPLDLIRRYGQIASAFHTQRDKLSQRITSLRTTRDLLLPKLVSGEVNVETPEEEALAATV